MDNKIIQHRSYKELKTEIEICGTGEIFSILCPDIDGVEDITAYLKKDIPSHSFLSFHMDERENDFLSFFQDEFSREYRGNRVFNIAGIENLPEAVSLDFMGYIQGLRKSFNSESWCLILWMPLEFEKKLFLLFPDIWRKISGIYDFSSFLSHRTPFKADRVLAEVSGRIAAYLKDVIHQYENWKSLHQGGGSFLIEIMGKADINNYYAPSCFSNKKGKVFLLDDLFTVFLENKNINFLTLLGDPGTGKSSFAIYYFIHLAKQYINEPDMHRIPLFISLKNHEGQLDADGFLLDMFEKNFGLKLSMIKLQDMLLRGKFIFFIDGFDDMASAWDKTLTYNNFKELAKLSVKNIILENGVEKPQPANKVFLTCRTHYFLSYVRGENMVKGGFTSLYREYAVKENYQIVRLNLKEFDEEGLKNYIIKNTKDGITARNVLGIITDHYNLNKLSVREILMEMIIRTVPFYRNKKELNAAELYFGYTSIWIDRNDWRFHMNPQGKREFLQKLALKMFQKGDGYLLRFSQADLPGPEGFKDGFRDMDGSLCREDVMTCEFLSCDIKGNYQFVHRSFMDYFISENYFLNIREGRERPVPYSHLREEMMIFLKLIVSSNKADLKNMDLSELDLEKINLYQADLAGSNLSKARLNSAVLINANLPDADLTAADLSNAKLTRANCSNTDLTGADFRGSRLREADLTRARFNGANLNNADLRGAKLHMARLAWTDLGNADLSGADLSGANITDTDLSGVNLDKAILNEADLTGSNLTRAILTGVDLTSAGLNNVDLSNVNLTKTIFKWADLHGANLSMAILHKACLREADLTRANLDDTDCREADIRWANLQGAKLRDANLQEADLTGADLSRAKLTCANLTWVNLSAVNFQGADLADAKLNMSKAGESNFKGANLTNADLTWADLANANFTDADLTNANLSEADLTGAVFTNANLTRANLKGSSLREADLSKANQEDAEFDGADLTDAKIQ